MCCPAAPAGGEGGADPAGALLPPIAPPETLPVNGDHDDAEPGATLPPRLLGAIPPDDATLPPRLPGASPPDDATLPLMLPEDATFPDTCPEVKLACCAALPDIALPGICGAP